MIRMVSMALRMTPRPLPRRNPVMARALHRPAAPKPTITKPTPWSVQRCVQVGAKSLGVVGAGLLAAGVVFPTAVRYLVQATLSLHFWTEKKLDHMEARYIAMRRAAAERNANQNKKA